VRGRGEFGAAVPPPVIDGFSNPVFACVSPLKLYGTGLSGVTEITVAGYVPYTALSDMDGFVPIGALPNVDATGPITVTTPGGTFTTTTDVTIIACAV
jgi:hypothetical protein